ncbi:MAG: TRAP transporter substrate-binding protein [Rhodobacteraceae bacterium]|nr:TRAP transporter substrate-binding protein [Paracoccaceae bacterium]
MSKFTGLKSARILAGAATAALLSTQAQTADVTLTISSWAPPSHAMNAEMWPNLIKMIEGATDGKVTAEIRYGLAPPPAQMDVVMDGAADITWIFNGYNPGRFVATKLIELPGYEGNAQAASTAYWRVYEAMLADLDEHKGVKVIGLMTHGPGQFHSRKPVNSLADIGGMKVRIGGGVAGDVGAALRMSGIRVPAPKVYETLDSGAADAVAMPAEGRLSFRLTEVAPHFYTMPGGLYRGAFALIMNEDTFASLSEDQQKALQEKVFGEPLSTMAGAVWDAADKRGIDATAADAENTMTVASASDQEAFAEIAAEVINKVKAEINAMGVDADAAIAMIREEMAN